MASEANKACVRRVLDEVVSQGRVALVDDLLAADFAHVGNAGVRRGRAVFADIVTRWRAAFPDLRLTIDHLVAEGDLVFSAVTMRGTQRGPFTTPQWGTLAPSGKACAVKHVHCWRLAGGLVAEHWAVRDDLGMLRQLGHLPAPAAAPVAPDTR